MFRITKDPSSGRLIQYLAIKLQDWPYHVRWHGRCRCYGSIFCPWCVCVVHCIGRHSVPTTSMSTDMIGPFF